MKIIQIMPEFGLAGAERMCQALTIDLKNKGHEVIVCSLYDYHSDITEKIENEGIKIIYLDKKNGFDISMYQKLKKVFKTVKPDIIHTHRYVCKYVVPATYLAHVKSKIVHTVHSVAQKEANAKKLQYFFYHCGAVTPVAISETVKKSILDYYKLKTNQVPLVENGLDMSNYLIKRKYEQNDKFFSFLHVGRFSVEKNHNELINAFFVFRKNHPDSRLYLVGTGDLLEEIKNKAENLRLDNSVVFVGLVNDVSKWYEKADAFILPSIYEGMPMTLIESMGRGLPIIASNVGGIPDMIADHKEGLLCDSSADSILKAMEEVYASKELRELLGRNALKKSAAYSSNMMCEKYISIYEKYINGK